MAAALVPDTLWSLIEQLLPMPLPKPQGADRAFASRALFSCSEPVFPGRCCQKDWGAAQVWSAGDDCGTGSRMEFGIWSTSHCWMGFRV